MKDKLRELAKDLAEKEKDYAPFERRFSEELLAILDAEGDGGTPLPGVVWNERTDAAHLIKRGTEVEFCAEYGCCRVFTHPARSGVVSDEDERAVDAMRALLVKSLMAYRCIRTVDEDGEPLPLVDALSPGEGGTIQPGTEEIEYLAEYLAYELQGPPAQAAQVDEKVVVIRDGQATTEGLVLAAAIYMGAVKDIFALRSDGPPYNERKVTKDVAALRAFDHLDAATKALRSAISHFASTADPATQPHSPDAADSGRAYVPRFFIDHTMIHDRVTGKHVTCDPDFRDYVINPGEITRINNPDGISNTCALLNNLDALAAQTVDVESVRAVISGLRDYDDSAFNTWADKLSQAIGDKT